MAESFNINAERIEKPGETQKVLDKAIRDNESILLDVTIAQDEFLPMIPLGGNISETVGEYKLEKGD